MPDSIKNIKFKTTIEGSEDVKKEFEDINQSIDKTSNTADTKLKPVLEDTKDGLDDVSESAGGTTSKFAGLAGGILGGAGVVAAMFLVKEIFERVSA